MILGLWLCRDVLATSDWKDRAKILDPARLRRMLVVNTDIMIRSVLLLAIFVAFTMWSGGMGDVSMAANQILLQFLQFTAYALDGFAFAAEALVGRAVGARLLPEFRRAVWLSGLWGITICAALSLIFWVFGTAIVAVLAEASQVRVEGGDLSAVAGGGACDWMRVLDARWYLYRGDEDAGYAGYDAGLGGRVFAVTPFLMGWLGNHGLWLGLILSFVMRAVTLGCKYPALERSVLVRNRCPHVAHF